MKKTSSSMSAFITRRNLLGGLLCVSSISLAIFSLAATPAVKNKSTASNQTVVTQKTSAATHAALSAAPQIAPNAPTPPSGTLSPGNPTITYTDGPLVPNTTGL